MPVDVLSKAAARANGEVPCRATCVFCRCTDERACNPPCYWIDEEHTVCSAAPCVDAYFGDLAKNMRRMLQLARVGLL